MLPGIMVVLQEEPLDKDNEEHQKLVAKAEAEMGFPDLLKSELVVEV